MAEVDYKAMWAKLRLEVRLLRVYDVGESIPLYRLSGRIDEIEKYEKDKAKGARTINFDPPLDLNDMEIQA